MPILLDRPGGDAAKSMLADHYQGLISIRGYVLALSKTNLTPVSDPPPSWYDGLVAKIDAAKAHTSPWTTELEPAITSTLPGQIVEFGTRLQTATNGILAILQATPKPSPDDAKKIADQLDWLRRGIGDHKADIDKLRADFVTFQRAADADLHALNDGADSVQHDLNIDNALVAKLQGDQRSDQADIDADKAAMAKAGVAAGVGIFVGASTLVVSGATGIGAVIGGFVIAGAVIEAATVLSIYGVRLADAQRRYDQDTADLTAEQNQVASLTLVKGVVDNLIGLNGGMSQSLSDVSVWWSTIEQKLGTVVDDVAAATSDDDQQAWLLLGDDIRATQTEWADLAAFAQNMQNAALGATVQVISAKDGVAA
ncbi:MAG TPA: hypothetical protein VMD91_13595 [Candidatus Sulfotelmatobacter sp.]|nr:hypothetical protein [Candidatus Sulfotelmatobacter sp.]